MAVVVITVVAITFLGFAWYSDPILESCREDYTLSDIFPKSGSIKINGDGKSVNFVVLKNTRSKFKMAGGTNDGVLIIRGISVVRFDNVTSDELLKDEYILGLLDDYDLLRVTDGCVMVLKEGYVVALPVYSKCYNKIDYAYIDERLDRIC